MLGLALLLAACGSRVELFSAANESEANEVLSVLLDAGIAAQKATTKTGVAVSVDGQQVARALDILRARGLPRERFDGMGQIFRKEGLVSSPLEERARYIYALSQELTNTLSQMDGVL
ncbi:EscJ/YscJ/HrcJ family type III secretion inner membrane ring protein, partial [Campylobacter lari]|nr:EscJ/YscJ/HrcJ family type III secretion inner membrane ring protein [Campylobacter lari]